MLIQILILNGHAGGGNPTFVWEPQEAFSPAPPNFKQKYILSFKSYFDSFR
jgi:hypothetical protein